MNKPWVTNQKNILMGMMETTHHCHSHYYYYLTPFLMPDIKEGIIFLLLKSYGVYADLWVTWLALNSTDGQSMIGVTAGGRVIHICRKDKSNFSVRVSSKVNCDGCCHSERKTPQQDTESAATCMGLPTSEVKLHDCKCVYISIQWHAFPWCSDLLVHGMYQPILTWLTTEK